MEQKISNIVHIKDAIFKKEDSFNFQEKLQILNTVCNLTSIKECKNTNQMKTEIKELYNWFQNLLLERENIPLYKKMNIKLEETFGDDYILCLEKGCIEHNVKLKTLIKHLKSKHDMSFNEYKNKWDLGESYPSVCKNYSEIRQMIARKGD